MPMPLWIRFAPIEYDLSALIMDRLADVRSGFTLEPYSEAPIVEEHGYVYVSDAQERLVSSIDALFFEPRNTFGVDIDFVARTIARHVRFLWFGAKAPYTLCIAVDAEARLIGSDAWGPRGWVPSFLSKVANRLDTQCAALATTREYSGVFEPLDQAQFLEVILNGKFLKITPPCIFALHRDIVTGSEFSHLEKVVASSSFRLQWDGDMIIGWQMG